MSWHCQGAVGGPGGPLGPPRAANFHYSCSSMRVLAVARSPVTLSMKALSFRSVEVFPVRFFQRLQVRIFRFGGSRNLLPNLCFGCRTSGWYRGCHLLVPVL